MSDELRPGVTVGRYQILGLLGEGGMGMVWSATHLALRKPVVIKVLRRELASNREARSRFLREGEAAARVRHPHVVEILDVGMRADVPYLVMEHLEGEDLATRIVRERVLPVAELVEVMLPVCAGVSAAHEEGVVHRDLKPENLFLARTREGATHPKVLDFGISRVVDDHSGRVRTNTAVMLGTPEYMSPEQARGERVIDDRSDQYSLGVILYECATGSLPIPQGAPFAVLSRVVAGQFPRPRAVRPELAEAFEAIILRAMALRPEERFPSVRALGRELLAFAPPRARVLWEGVFEATDGETSRRATTTLDDDVVIDPRFVIPARVGPNDTLLDDGVREATTLPLKRAAKRRTWVMVVGAGLVVLLLALAVWELS